MCVCGGGGKKMLSAPFLTPAETKISVLLSVSVERFGVSRMRDFYLYTSKDGIKGILKLKNYFLP